MKINKWKIAYTDSTGEKLHLSKVYEDFDEMFSGNGFTKAKRRLFFDNKKELAVIDAVHVHYGFRYTLEGKTADDLHILIAPRQVITPDGKTYNPEFAKENHVKLMERKEYNFKYKKRCEFLRKFDNTFSNGKAFATKNRSEISLELVANDLDILFVQEPELEFGTGKYHTWPAAGLKRFFPLAYNLSLPSHPSQIKLLLIGKKDCFKLLKTLKEGEKGPGYPFPGFGKIYKTDLVMGTDRFVELTDQEITFADSAKSVVDLLVRKAISVRNKGVAFDICLIELVDEWKRFFINQEFDLHDQIKVAFYKQGIRTQLFNRKALDATDGSGNLYDHLSLGIYFKSGGNPWKLKSSVTNTAYIGISFGTVENERRLIGIAEIFDSYGQYLSLRSLSIKESSEARNFKDKDLHLSIDQFTSLVIDLINDYKDVMNGNFPANLIIHKTSDFNTKELQLKDRLKDYPIKVSLVYIQTDHFYNLITEDSKEPTRGLYWRMSTNSSLLYSSGAFNEKYFFPGAPIPLLINLAHSDNFDINDITKQVVGLTKLNFNSTNTFSKEPVTILHSRKIVDLLRAGLEPNNIPTDPRFYL